MNGLGQCCGKQPRPYKKRGYLLCTRCDRAYDIATDEQIENYAWVKRNGQFVDRLAVSDGHQWIELDKVVVR